MKKSVKKDEKGFTIIEVMIVLAIAALILVVVLVAIPQLQRNQRNQARQSVTSRVVAELGNYAGNNNGRYPQNQTQLDEFEARYLGNVDITDPQTGNNFEFDYVSSVSNDDGAATGASVGTFQYAVGHECDGEQVNSNSNTRQFALFTELEGGAIYCLDNR